MENNIQTEPIHFSKRQVIVFSASFLILYWLFGFDGITFSDDVYYLLAGRDFWNGLLEVNDYHFSSRWGAYIPAGLITHFFGIKPHLASLVSLLYYLISYFLLVSLFRKNNERLIFSLWFITPIYFLHFITKVYPDTLLVLCISAIFWSAVNRAGKPEISGFLMSLAFIIGILTKETIILLGLFPIVLFLMDLRLKQFNSKFYFTLLITGAFLLSLYLGYYWIKFDDPFFRIQSVNAGHYISEFTYADKGWKKILERITYLPILTLVERAYWPWIVFSVPAIAIGLKTRQKGNVEFGLGILCLLIGFWFMSSTLELYNPIYLNPRHLIIIIPPLAFLVSMGWTSWRGSVSWKKILTGLIILGAIISLFQKDWKMSFFQIGFLAPIWISNPRLNLSFFAILLISPTLYSIYYQKQLKTYPDLVHTLNVETQDSKNQQIIITNNFLVFSKEVLLPGKNSAQDLLIPIEKVDSLNIDSPSQIRVLIYKYYLHAYPQEGEDIEKLESWLKVNYRKVNENQEGQVWLRFFEKK
ncbi:hypothetical protein E4S40_03785 [Algoriphagus kandeliae]|uniref:Uncharacterized protein n=1 Tax=Algoriphagus kandeliae TaxID=2562278 RepID=A0A4Y9R026_9BACT|nr:hypothetical protein [Algoriphagus kandeliae]TFV97770.1 hypothetical protein E4S40_03785 [Algoriphagus kandeliae]